MISPPTWFLVALPVVVVAAVVVILIASGRLSRNRIKPNKTPPVRMSEKATPREVKAATMIPIRYTQMKKEKGELKRITTNRMGFLQPKVRLGVRFILVKTGLQALPNRMHFVVLKNLDANGELSFDEDYSESINPDTGQPEFSEELEDILTQGLHQQMIEVATQFWKFVFQRQHLIFMGLGIAAFAFVALGVASAFHLGGGIQVDWTQHPIGGRLP